MEDSRFTVRAVARVRNDRDDPADTDNWGGVISTIVLEPEFDETAFAGLADFSHVEVLFVFDRMAERPSWEPRPPRGRPDLPAVGVFADRGPRRPNRVGASFCRLVAVNGREIRLEGLDAVDGTPVIDIKPVMATFLPTNTTQPEWVSRLLSEYY